MSFNIIPAHDLPFDVQATIFNRAFAGYLAGWTDLDAAGLAKSICAQGIDLCYSRFVFANGQPAGFGYVNRTGNISRLAGMGVVPEARGGGASRFLLFHLLDEAKLRNDEAIVLEVFEQNLPALALYRRSKFREPMRLLGWRRAAQKIRAQIKGDLEEISLLEAGQIRGSDDFPDVPWQTSHHAVAKLAHAHAYKIGDGCVVIGNPKITPTRIYALLGDDCVALRNVLGAVLRTFRDNEFFAREIFPEKFSADVFESLGFACERLNQILMRRDLG
jgi:GNAT superfamily N-acetyltransferase